MERRSSLKSDEKDEKLTPTASQERQSCYELDQPTLTSNIITRGIDVENCDFEDEPNMSKLDMASAEQDQVIKCGATTERFTEIDRTRITADESVQ